MSRALILGPLVLLAILMHPVVSAQPISTRADVLQAEPREMRSALSFVVALEPRRHRNKDHASQQDHRNPAQEQELRAANVRLAIGALRGSASVRQRFECVSAALEALQAVFGRGEISLDEYRRHLQDLRGVAEEALDVATPTEQQRYQNVLTAVRGAQAAIGDA